MDGFHDGRSGNVFEGLLASRIPEGSSRATNSPKRSSVKKRVWRLVRGGSGQYGRETNALGLFVGREKGSEKRVARKGRVCTNQSIEGWGGGREGGDEAGRATTSFVAIPPQSLLTTASKHPSCSPFPLSHEAKRAPLVA